MDVKTDILLTSSFISQAANSYDPNLGWATTWNPEETAARCKSTLSYLNLASHAIPAYDRKATDFLKRNGLKYMTVSQAEYHEGFEEAPVVNGVRCTFEQWAESVRRRQGLGFKPDVIYVAASAKGFNRSDEKAADPDTENKNIHATKDYVRGMFIFMNGRSPRQLAGSLTRMMDLKTSIIDQTDPFGALGRKDQYALPHKHTRYRGLHVVTECVVEDGSKWDGYSILGEAKFELSGQQDVLRLTRDMQDVRRDIKKKVHTMPDVCGYDAARDMAYYYTLDEKLERVTIDLHNMVHARMGLNAFLVKPADPQDAIDVTPVTVDQLNNEIRELARTGTFSIKNMLAVNGVAIPGMETPKYIDITSP